MQLKWITALPVAAVLVLLPSISPAQTNATKTAGVVELTHNLDANKLAPGATIQTRLVEAVHLPDGTTLPRGSWLDATVEQDDMQIDGKIKFALRFTDAKTKDGKTIPIKAMIIAVATQVEPVANDPDLLETMLPVSGNLNNQTQGVDALGVASGVDMYSKTSSQNSGVFVTTKKNDVKLPNGTKLALAITSGM
jgi:hypothetical protein